MRRVSRISVRPALLMALPLVVTGILAVHVLEADYALLRARQDEAALGILHGLGEVARAAVERTAEGAVRQVAAADRTEALRSLAVSGTIEFMTLHREGRRVFPPEEPASLLVWERERLSLAGGALASARAGLVSTPQTWVWSPGPDGGALAHCRRNGDQSDFCVLLGVAQLRAALAHGLGAAYRDGGEGWTLALIDPSGRSLWSLGEARAEPATMILPLDGPLRGWRAEAGLDPGAVIGRPPALTLAAVVLPLLGSWLLLAWHFQRSQQARLADSRHRAEIAAQLSHELRTPLANLRVYVGLIHRRAEQAAAVRDYCAVVDAEADRLSRLADNAIAFARGETPDGAGRAAAVPDAVAQDAVERLRLLCAAACCPVTVNADAPLTRRFDGAAVEQILTNLIDNARKYAPGGPIEVATWVDRTDGGERLFLAVRDYGPGVPPHLGQRIFDPMVRGGGTATGFGLGLAAVRRLTRANGGGVRVEDARPGARFVAWIRLDPLEGAPEVSEEGACVF